MNMDGTFIKRLCFLCVEILHSSGSIGGGNKCLMLSDIVSFVWMWACTYIHKGRCGGCAQMVISYFLMVHSV